MNAQTRSWFISAAVASVKLPLCCTMSCSALSACLTLAWWKIYLRISIKNRHCLQNNINSSMKIKLIWETMQDFSPCSLFALPGQFQKSPSPDFIWRGTTSRDFVARGRPLCGQERHAPLAKRSTCGKSTRPGNKAHQTLPVNRLSVWGKGEKNREEREGKGKRAFRT